MLKKSVVYFIAILLLNIVSWNSLIFSQEEPNPITPDVRFSPAVTIYNFTDYYGIEDGKYYLDFDLTIPKDGIYEVSTFSASTGVDDTDTVLRYYDVDGYSGEYITDDIIGDDNFSKITFEGSKGERHYFRVLPIDISQNNRSFGICYECKEITEPKKFMIGMYTMDFDNPINFVSQDFNPSPIGHEDEYYQTLKEDNFNFIIPWHQLTKPMQVLPNTYPNRGFLDRALANGIDVIITAPMVNYYHYTNMSSVPFDQDVCEQTVNYFDGHPAVIGYHVMDEPHFKIGETTIDYDRIANANNVIATNSKKPNYIDLKPMYPPKQYFWSGYYTNSEGWYTHEEYVNEQLDPFINQCNPDYLVIECYIFWSGVKDDSAKVNLFRNYHLLASKATLLNKDFMPVLCLNSSISPDIPLTPKEFDYTVYACLFHCVKGLSYYAREWWDGDPTSIYIGRNMWDLHVPADTKSHLRELHGKIQSKSDILVDLKYRSSYHYSAQSTIWPSFNEDLPLECLWSEFQNNSTAQKYFDTDTPFKYTSGSPVENLAISFLTDSEGSDYFWIFNKNYSGDYIDFQINFASLVNLTEIFNDEYNGCISNRTVLLDACDAKLFKISRTIPDNIITGIIRIPSGSTLTIKNDEVLTLLQNSEIIVESGGQLILNPYSKIVAYPGSKITVENGGIFRAVESEIAGAGSGTWTGIIAEVGSTISTYSSSITNAEWGINAQAASVSLIHTSFSDCENGVWLLNCSDYNIYDNYFGGKGTGTGVRVTESAGVLRSNTILNHSSGITAVSCSPLITENYLHDNSTCGIALFGYNTYPQLLNPSTSNDVLNNRIINNGLITTGENGSQIYVMYRANAYMNNGCNNIYSGNENSIPVVPCIKTVSDIGVSQQKSEVSQIVKIPAEYNYWGMNEIVEDEYSYFFEMWRDGIKGYGIDYDPYATSPYEVDTYQPPHYSTNEPPTQEEQLLKVAMLLEENGVYKASIKKYETLIEKYPDSPEYYIATSRLPQVLAKEEESLEPLFITYDDAIDSEEISNKKFIKQMKISTKIKSKKYDDAIILAEELKDEAETDMEKNLCDIEIAICNMMINAQKKDNKSSANDLTVLNQLVDELIIDVKGEPADVSESVLPKISKLYQNYPNPFNPITQIKFDIAKSGDIKLSVYNISGQKVAELANGVKNAGYHTVEFDGSKLNSGIYYYTLEDEGKSLTQKMILMK